MKKQHMTVVEVDDIEEDVQKRDNKIVSAYAAMMNMEVESEPIVVQIKDFVNISSSSMILIDSTPMHNMTLTPFTKKLGLLLIPT
jgi:hypothetical protein